MDGWILVSFSVYLSLSLILISLINSLSFPFSCFSPALLHFLSLTLLPLACSLCNHPQTVFHRFLIITVMKAWRTREGLWLWCMYSIVSPALACGFYQVISITVTSQPWSAWTPNSATNTSAQNTCRLGHNKWPTLIYLWIQMLLKHFLWLMDLYLFTLMIPCNVFRTDLIDSLQQIILFDCSWGFSVWLCILNPVAASLTPCL